MEVVIVDEAKKADDEVLCSYLDELACGSEPGTLDSAIARSVLIVRVGSQRRNCDLHGSGAVGEAFRLYFNFVSFHCVVFVCHCKEIVYSTWSRQATIGHRIDWPTAW